MLGFMKSMDKYSQRAHDKSCRIGRKLNKMKVLIPKNQLEEGNIPKVLNNSKVIAQPYRDFVPKLNNLTSKIQGKDRFDKDMKL